MAEVKNKKNVKKAKQENLDTNKVDSTKKERGNKNMVKLIGLVGTNSKKSTNRQLLQYIKKHFDLFPL